MKLFFRLLIATLCLILSFGIIEAKIQHPASAQVSPPIVKNGSFDEIGSNGSPVTTIGQNGQETGAESAAASWRQFAEVPDSIVTTELIPSTDPLPGGGGNMLHYITNDGQYPPAQAGNGLDQPFFLPNGGVAEFDLLVITGQVTGGLVLSTGSLPSNVQTFTPTDDWIHVVTNVVTSPVQGIGFETLTLNAGAEYYVDNLQVHQFCN